MFVELVGVALWGGKDLSCFGMEFTGLNKCVNFWTADKTKIDLNQRGLPKAVVSIGFIEKGFDIPGFNGGEEC